MKRVILILTIIFIATTSFTPGNGCESYFPPKVGVKTESTSYDAKDKVVSRTVSVVTSYEEIDGGFQASINSEVFDAKNKSMSKGDVTMKCQDDKFYMDMSGMFPKDLAAIQGAEVEIDNQFIAFPSHPVAGQTLPDETSTMTIKLNGTPMMTMTIKTTNRKVEGFESVTTPAGTYECVKFSSTTEVSSMMMNTKSSSVMYMSKNIGAVKNLFYDDKGNLQGSQLLTKYTE